MVLHGAHLQVLGVEEEDGAEQDVRGVRPQLLGGPHQVLMDTGVEEDLADGVEARRPSIQGLMEAHPELVKVWPDEEVLHPPVVGDEALDGQAEEEDDFWWVALPVRLLEVADEQDQSAVEHIRRALQDVRFELQG